MAYPLSERPERQKKPESNNKPFLTAEREAIEEGVAELVQWEPVQQALRTPVIQAVGGGLRTFVQGATEFGEYLKEEARNPPENLLERGPALAGTVLTGVEALTEKTQRGFEMYATGAPIQNPITGESLGNVPNLNVDPAVARLMGGAAAETLLGAGVSKVTTALKNIPPAAPPMTPAFATANAGVKLNFKSPDALTAPQVAPLTVSDPELLAPGIVPGVGQSKKYKKGITRLRKMEKDQAIKLKEYQRQLNDGEIDQKQFQSRMAKMKKFEDANYSTLGTPDDPDIFEVKSEVQRDPTNPALPAHQHHAAAKSMTAPWVKRALKLGDDDDVAAFFEFHRMLTGSGMGNARSGIIDMPGFAHIARDARNEAEKALAVHSFMQKQGAGVQILSSEVEKMIGNPKNMEELMRSYMTFAEEYLIPQKELSLKRLKGALSDHRKTLPKSQRARFDDLVDKLNKANT